MSKSRYPIWWDKSITIYNKYEDPQTQIVRWYRHVIEDCFWKYVGDRVSVGETILDTTSIVCRIPQDKMFLPKHEWIKMPDDEMGNYFTLARGDIIVADEVYDTIDEYISGHRSTDLISKYKELQGCLEIESFSINTSTGVNNPHYYIRGV